MTHNFRQFLSRSRASWPVLPALMSCATPLVAHAQTAAPLGINAQDDGAPEQDVSSLSTSAMFVPATFSGEAGPLITAAPEGEGGGPASSSAPSSSPVPSSAPASSDEDGSSDDHDAPTVPDITANRRRNIGGSSLRPLTDKEAMSWLLPSELDSLRRTDVPDAYYVPTTVGGHLITPLDPLRASLKEKGFSFSFSYKAEAMGNIDGGVERGADYVHELTLQMHFDLDKLLGLHGWTLHTLVMNRVGHQVSTDRLGEHYINLMEVYGLTGGVAAHLVDFYLQKTMFDGRLDLALGRMSLTHVFATSPLLCSFMVTCSAPVILKRAPGFAVYPKATMGGRVRFRPTRDTSIQFGVYQVTPLASNPSGWAWGSEHTTGVMVPVEFTWQPFLTAKKLPGHYVFGYAHDSSRYNDLMTTSAAAAVTPGDPSRRAPMNMYWFEGDQMIYRKGGNDQMSGGYLMFGYVHNTARVAALADQFYAGFSFNGVIPHRNTDRFGVLWTYYKVSKRLQLNQTYMVDTGQSLGAAVLAPQSSSHVIEAYYGIDVMPGLQLQPEFDYMIRPGETSKTPNATLLGMKIIANF